MLLISAAVNIFEKIRTTAMFKKNFGKSVQKARKNSIKLAILKIKFDTIFVVYVSSRFCVKFHYVK